jgi:hypothetical protein
MAQYAFHQISLEVLSEGKGTTDSFDRLLQDMTWAPTFSSPQKPLLRLSVRRNGQGVGGIPHQARQVFEVEGFEGYETGPDFYLTYGPSCFYLQSLEGKGVAYLASSFSDQPPLLQQKFFAYGLIRLLRPLGLFSLHAASLLTPDGVGVLIVGSSGSGKSTLTIGLIRKGWGYLSDDAVLLRKRSEVVEALALRRHCYIDAQAAGDYQDFRLGEPVPDASGGQRQRVYVDETYPGQAVATSVPQVLVFSRIVPEPNSTLQPVTRVEALKNLLTESGPQLFDQFTMAQHMEVLKTLLSQTKTYELRAGLDLHRDPLTP